MRLKDKVAIVTGSSGGLGRVIALILAKEGAKVVINDINEDALKATALEIEKLGQPVLVCPADVTNKAQIEGMVQSAVNKFGSVDILVNNAGGALHTPAPLAEVQEEHWNKVIDVNLKGAFFCCQAVIAQMRRQKTGGKIVNISAMAGRTYATLAGAQYTSAKAGIGGLTRHLAREFGPDGINVNAVAPTVMLTGERVKGLWQAKTEEERNRTLQSIPLRRLAEPEEVARVVLFLASEDASYVTGVTLDVNGGRFMC
ncbi:MAG: glucose 1-dehydrogenase [Actinobacteria bacterium]|nr:glucose 1-dehydrogenase [Actinomycetota bacterium]